MSLSCLCADPAEAIAAIHLATCCSVASSSCSCFSINGSLIGFEPRFSTCVFTLFLQATQRYSHLTEPFALLLLCLNSSGGLATTALDLRKCANWPSFRSFCLYYCSDYNYLTSLEFPSTATSPLPKYFSASINY